MAGGKTRGLERSPLEQGARFVRLFISCLIFSWTFAGWPQIGFDTLTTSFNFLPGIQEAQAATVTRTFDFLADAEGWVENSPCANATGTFVTAPVADGVAGNPPGSLEMDYNKAGGGGESCLSYWEWSGTWEDLGVPAGGTVM